MKTVVYIDDEPTICKLMSRVLRLAGVEVIAFTDPEEAIAQIHTVKPALVICDYRMPKMDGLALRERLEIDVPFVLISGALDIDDERVQLVQEVLVKPVETELLIEKVKTLLADA
jgi:two-component system C4-dicarboxylate transport response regulator DctD